MNIYYSFSITPRFGWLCKIRYYPTIFIRSHHLFRQANKRWCILQVDPMICIYIYIYMPGKQLYRTLKRQSSCLSHSKYQTLHRMANIYLYSIKNILQLDAVYVLYCARNIYGNWSLWLLCTTQVDGMRPKSRWAVPRSVPGASLSSQNQHLVITRSI